MADRAESIDRGRDPRNVPAWLTPQFAIQLLIFVGTIIGFYVMGERRTTIIEAAAANLDSKATKIEGQLSSIVSSVQTMATADARQQAVIESLQDQVRNLERSVVDNEKAQRDYNYNISTRLKGVEVKTER